MFDRSPNVRFAPARTVRLNRVDVRQQRGVERAAAGHVEQRIAGQADQLRRSDRPARQEVLEHDPLGRDQFRQRLLPVVDVEDRLCQLPFPWARIDARLSSRIELPADRLNVRSARVLASALEGGHAGQVDRGPTGGRDRVLITATDR